MQSLVPASSVIGPHAASLLSWRQCVSEWTRRAERRRGRSWRRMSAVSPEICAAEPPQGPDGNVNESIWKDYLRAEVKGRSPWSLLFASGKRRYKMHILPTFLSALSLFRHHVHVSLPLNSVLIRLIYLFFVMPGNVICIKRKWLNKPLEATLILSGKMLKCLL